MTFYKCRILCYSPEEKKMADMGFEPDPIDFWQDGVIDLESVTAFFRNQTGEGAPATRVFLGTEPFLIQSTFEEFFEAMLQVGDPA